MTEQQQPNTPIYTDQTIQWARESLQRRRKELQEKKKSLVASYKQSSSTNNDDDSTNSQQPTSHKQQQKEANGVTAMLERGRSLLAEAEAHSEILGRYASPSSSNVMNEDEDEEDGSSTRSSTTRDDSMSRFLQETNQDNNDNDEHKLDSTNNSTTHNDKSRIISTLPVEMPAWDKEFSSDGDLVDNNNNNTTNSNNELQKLLQEGEARARLDELIANVRRQGDDKRYATELLDAHNNTPTKKITTFDPSSMYAARRAELKKIKLEEEVAAAEEEARALSSFKALPLPGGVQVKNNPFASTQSFEMKQVGSVEKLVRRDSKLYDNQQHNKSQQHDESSSVCSTFGSGTEESMSMATTKISASHHNNTINTSFTNCSESYAIEEDRQRAKQLRTEKKMKKKQLLDAVNQTIMAKDMNESLVEGDDDVRSTTTNIEGCYDVVEDPSKLRQDIARLEAKLKQKKTQRLAILNDIVAIDLDAPFDRLLSSDSGSGDDNDGIRHIIDRLKKQVCGSVNDFQDINTSTSSSRDDDETSSYERHTTRASLFERQEEWARQREQKLFEARLQSEANAMQGITDRPQLSHAARSWRKAKESHDTTLKRCAEIEERKQQEKEAKEKATNELKMKELEELQRQANLAKLNKSSSSIKSDDVNKEEQTKRLEMLSKPRQTREPHHHHDAAELKDAVGSGQQQKTTSEIFGGSPPKPNKQKPSKPFFSKSVDRRVIKTVHDVISSVSTSVNDVKERPDELFHGKHSFSDMSDKEFAKLVRRIEKQAAMSSSAKMMKQELAK